MSCDVEFTRPIRYEGSLPMYTRMNLNMTRCLERILKSKGIHWSSVITKYRGGVMLHYDMCMNVSVVHHLCFGDIIHWVDDVSSGGGQHSCHVCWRHTYQIDWQNTTHSYRYLYSWYQIRYFLVKNQEKPILPYKAMFVKIWQVWDVKYGSAMMIFFRVRSLSWSPKAV